MGKYDELTKYIPLLKDDSFGKWHVDPALISFFKGNKGKQERPFEVPFVDYSDNVNNFIDDFNEFCEAHPEYEHTRYRYTLKDYGLEWNEESFMAVDVSKKDAKCVIALIQGIIRAERFCDGAMLPFFREGYVLRWLERLKEMDESDL